MDFYAVATYVVPVGTEEQYGQYVEQHWAAAPYYADVETADEGYGEVVVSVSAMSVPDFPAEPTEQDHLRARVIIGAELPRLPECPAPIVLNLTRKQDEKVFEASLSEINTQVSAARTMVGGPSPRN